jgi:hypothetical protein
MGDISLTIPGDALATAKIPRHRLESELKKQEHLAAWRADAADIQPVEDGKAAEKDPGS